MIDKTRYIYLKKKVFFKRNLIDNGVRQIKKKTNLDGTIFCFGFYYQSLIEFCFNFSKTGFAILCHFANKQKLKTRYIHFKIFFSMFRYLYRRQHKHTE